LPVRFEIGIFYLNRARFISQYAKERPAKDVHSSLAFNGVHEVDQLRRVAFQVIELFRPSAVADVMLARGHKRHLDPFAAELVLRLRLKRVEM